MAASSAAQPWLALDSRWGVFIAALWLAASAVRLTRLAVHAGHLRGLWKTAVPIESGALSATLTARRMEVCAAPMLDRPCAIGFFWPRILIPEELLSRLKPAELEQIVLHEAAHLCRRDDWSNLLQQIALVLFPLNPALAWIQRRLEREREMACDEAVVRRTRTPRAYAACLASLAEHRLELRRAQALSLGAWRCRPELARRVYSLLREQRTIHPFAARALVGAVCGLLLAAAIGLERCPRLVAFVAASSQQKSFVAAPALAQTNSHAAPVQIDRAAVSRRVAPRQTVATEIASREVAERAPFVAARHDSDAASTQPKMVLTDWEEQTAQDQASEPANPPVERRAVVRFFLTVYSADSPAAPAAGSSPASAPPDKKFLRPALRLPFDGWLVFEL